MAMKASADEIQDQGASRFHSLRGKALSRVRAVFKQPEPTRVFEQASEEVDSESVNTKNSKAVDAKISAVAVETSVDEIQDNGASLLQNLKTNAEDTKEALRTKGNEARDVLKTKLDETKDKAVVVAHDMKIKVSETKDTASVMLRDPQFQTCTIATAGGAITLSMAGGAFGLASGIVVGSTAGVLPALFTFGLSIPAGGAIGGTCGLCTGTLLGGASGGLGGFATYKYRIEIKDGMMTLKVRAQDTLTGTKDRVVMVSTAAKTKVAAQFSTVQVAVSDAASSTRKQSVAAVDLAKGKASEALNFATKTKVGVTSSSAAAGAVVVGTSAGAFGTVVGAAVGFIPAIFTFGLSIPAGAVVGMCVGTTVGGSAGAVGGGLAGYGGYTHGAAISKGVQTSCSKVSAKAGELKTKAFMHAADATHSVKSMIKASTGGSSD